MSDETIPNLEAWLGQPGCKLHASSETAGVHSAVGHRARLLRFGKQVSVGYGPDPETARAKAWQEMPARFKSKNASVPPPLPLDPFFIECVKRASENRELVAQFDRLRGTNLLRRGTAIDLAIDQASGKLEDDIRKFLEFVKEFVYERIQIYR